MWVWVAVLAVFGVAGVSIALYNRLVRLRVFVQEGWAQVEVQLTRRADLIPNLVSAVRNYAAHESALLSEVAELRSRSAHSADGPEARGVVETQLSMMLARVFAVAENYPDLKASTNFLALQKELAGTEDRIAAARRMYNSNVRKYNTACMTFPTGVLAGVFGFVPAEFFEASEESRATPVVGL